MDFLSKQLIPVIRAVATDAAGAAMAVLQSRST